MFGRATVTLGIGPHSSFSNIGTPLLEGNVVLMPNEVADDAIFLVCISILLSRQ